MITTSRLEYAMDSEYLQFKVEQTTTTPRKTKIYYVLNKHDGARLGVVKWWSPWRQYTYFQSPDVIMSAGCLGDLILFIQELNREHKKVIDAKGADKK